MAQMYLLLALGAVLLHCVINVHGGVMDQSTDLVRKLCLAQLQPDHVREFKTSRSFIEQFNIVLERYTGPDSLRCPTERETEAVKRCIEEKDSISELGELMRTPSIELCTQTFVNKLFAYNDKYLKDRSWYSQVKSQGLLKGLHDFGKKNKVMSRSLFEAYALEVSYHCQLTLVDKLRIANKKFVESDFELVMPWLKLKTEEATLIPDVPLDEIPADAMPTEINLKPSRQAAKGSFHVTKAGSLTNLFDIKVFKNIKKSAEFLVPTQLGEPVINIRKGCAKFRPYIDATIGPIVRMAHANLAVELPNLASELSKDDNLRRWLTVSQICIIFETLNISIKDGVTSTLEVHAPGLDEENSNQQQNDDNQDESDELVEVDGDLDAANVLDPEKKYVMSEKLTVYSSSLKRVFRKRWYHGVLEVLKFVYGHAFNQKGRNIVMVFRGKSKSENMDVKQFLTAFGQRMEGKSEDTRRHDKMFKLYTALGVGATVLTSIILGIPSILIMTGVISAPFAG